MSLSPTGPAFEEFFDIIRRLRAPDDGCPWDREQTARSLRSSLLEEAYECVDAIDRDDEQNLREELGDLNLLVTMIAYIKEQDDVFSVADVFNDISSKLIRRHPHVFGESSASTPDEIITQWDQIKVEVEGKRPKDSALDGVPASFPPLERAFKLQKKAAKVGFDWTEKESVFDKVREELVECVQAADAADSDALESELGDLLFSVVNVCRFLHVDPATALHRTNEKFVRRFHGVERGMKARGLPMNNEHLAEMDDLWNAEKARE